MSYLEDALDAWKCPLGEIRQRKKSGEASGAEGSPGRALP